MSQRCLGLGTLPRLPELISFLAKGIVSAFSRKSHFVLPCPTLVLIAVVLPSTVGGNNSYPAPLVSVPWAYLFPGLAKPNVFMVWPFT